MRPRPHLDEIQRRVDSRRPGGAGVLDMDRRRIAKPRLPQRHQRAFEPLAREPVVVDADGDGIHVLRRDARMVECGSRDLGDQAFDVRSFGFPEHGVGPTHDGG
jgi:hypothetical protein